MALSKCRFRNRAFCGATCTADFEKLFAKDSWDLELTHGKMILDVCQRSINNGAIASRLVIESRTGEFETDFVLCLSDDLIDEDMCTLTCELKYKRNVDPPRNVLCSSGVQILCGKSFSSSSSDRGQGQQLKLVLSKAHSGGGSVGALE